MSYKVAAGAASAALTTVLLVAPQAQAPRAPTTDALFSALQRGAVADIERLAAESGPDAVDGHGTPVLMAATLYADARIVELLLKRGADPNRADPAGATALMLAVSDRQKVRALIAGGADVNARSKTGRTPLLVASAFPRTLDVVRLLVENGADLRAQDQGGTGALALAARGSDLDVIQFLVSNGLDPKALSAAAARLAQQRNDLRIASYFVDRGLRPGPDTLMVAAMWQPPALVRRWTAAGGDVNAALPAAQYSRTALMTATTSESAGPETLQILLENGADANARTTEGETALDWAIYKGDRAKIAVLERHGARRGDGPRREDVPGSVPDPATDARRAVSRAVARLADVAPRFRDQTGCISCHHNVLPALVAGSVRHHGIAMVPTAAAKNIDDIATSFRGSVARMMVGDTPIGGEAMTTGYALLALVANGYGPDATTAAMTHWLLARQMPDGRWLGNGTNRPPSEYSTVTHTAMAAGGLTAYPLPGRSRDVVDALRRAARWLSEAEAQSAEERAMKLMGLVWTRAPRRRIADAVAQIRRTQENSGGWSQAGRTPPDAYATGLSLHALHLAGVSAGDPAYGRGVAFLLGTQYPDGAWLVKTHAFPVQRYFESGFAFGRHQWISAAGTSWAALALSHTLPQVPNNK